MRLWRYCLAGCLFDWMLYVVLTVIPLHANDLGASARELGVLGACSAIVYVGLSVVLGRVADRVSRPLLVRIGCGVMIAACVLIPRADSIAVLLALTPVVGASGTFFWPGVQAAIAAESTPERLGRDLGLFNIFWSTGKAGGFLTAAALKGGIGVGPTLLVAAAGAGAIALFYPLRDVRRAAEPAETPDRGTALLHMSWIMNFVGYGVGATVANQYIKLCKARQLGLGIGADPAEFFLGAFLCAVFLSQTAAFVALRTLRGWTHRRAPLHAGFLAMAAGGLMVAFLSDARVLLLAAPLLGVGFGIAYAASIYYSLHATRELGAYSGLHEAILGSGGFLMPLAAGWLATQSGDLRWPYWLCAGAALAGAAAAECLWRRRR